MSTSLYWKPVVDDWITLDDQLKFILREQFGYGPNKLDDSHLSFLNGLKAAKIKGAYDLMQAIDKYGEVIIQERG